MRRHHEDFEARGAQVVAVGQGTGEEAARIGRSLALPFRCLGDPGKQAYRAFGLTRDGWWNVTAKPFLEDPRLAFDRIRNASLKGSLMRHSDVLQLGGVAMVDRHGILRYLHRSRKVDDFPATSAVLAELDLLEMK